MVAVVAVLLLGLTAWALVPADPGSSEPTAVATSDADGVGSATTTPTTAAAGAPAAVTTPTASAPVVGSAPSGGAAQVSAAPATAAAPASRCGDLTATDQGVSATEIHVGTTLFNVFGANSTIDVQSADQQKQLYEAFWDTVNKAGGIQCRKVVGRYYEMNPLDQSSQQSGCLKIIADKNFAVVGAGGFFPQSEANCIPQNHIPLFTWYGMTPATEKRFSPYVFAGQMRLDHLMRTWVLGARDQGFFDPAKGFKKLGLWEINCDPDINAALDASLAEIGITGAKVTKFVGDCPLSGQTPPNQCAQAALQQRTAGVTHVFLVGGGSPNACFVNNAKRQNFNPRYSTSDYDIGIGPPTVGETPDADAFDGALGITGTRFGQIASGLPEDPGTRWCNQSLAAHHLPTMTKEDGNTLVTGTACAAVQQFLAVASHAVGMTRVGLYQGIPKVGRVAYGFPAADAVYDRPGKVSGGDYFRPVLWHKDCGCWKVATPTFRPIY